MEKVTTLAAALMHYHTSSSHPLAANHPNTTAVNWRGEGPPNGHTPTQQSHSHYTVHFNES